MPIASYTAMTNWQHVVSLLGETAREAGVLMIVFAPLEATFSEVPVTAVVVVVMFLLGVVMTAGGIILETRK